MQIVNHYSPEDAKEFDFHQFFVKHLKKVLWCELVVSEALPFLIKHSESEELVQSLSLFFLETDKQIARLEEVFSLLEIEMAERECEIVKGMTNSVCQVAAETRGKMRDSAIVLLLQQMISYQIVAYRTLSMYLRRTKKSKAANIIEESLAEKKNLDSKFQNQSVYINYAAMFTESYKKEMVQEDF